MTDVIVIGGGPAGLAACLYLLRAGKSVLLIEKEAIGGQIAKSPRLENYPAIESISGMEWADNAFSQVMGLGVKFDFGEVESIVKREDGVFEVKYGTSTAESRSVIIATGCEHKKLGLPGEEELSGHGVSYCATCDGAFFRNKDVMVYGYKDFAVEDGIYLASICSHVYFVYPHPLEATERHLEELSSCNNVELIEGEVSSFYGEQHLQGAALKTKGGERRIEVSGSFPLSEQLSGASYLSPLQPKQENGFLVVGKDHETSLKGIYAAGDVVAKKLRQIVNAASEGAECAIEAINYVRGR